MYAAFSRLAHTGDIVAYVSNHFDPECEYWPVEEASPVRGHGGLVGWIGRWLEAWDETWDVIEEILEDGDVVVASTRVHGRGRMSGMEISQRLIDVFELRDGKVLRITEYLDPREALRAAGLRGSVDSGARPHRQHAGYCAGDVAGERRDHPSHARCLEPSGHRSHPCPDRP
jgi:ketosteroid isomerase-like protein